VAIALVAYLEGIAVAKALADRCRQQLHAGRELVAVGAANISAGLFQAFPVAGGFSRSAVNFAAGARTPVATLVTAAVVAVTVAFLTPALHHLPYAVLAAIVVTAVLGLVDVRAALATWRAHRADGLLVAVTFLATLLLGVELGLAIGIAGSLTLRWWRVARGRLTRRRVARDRLTRRRTGPGRPPSPAGPPPAHHAPRPWRPDRPGTPPAAAPEAPRRSETSSTVTGRRPR
jgi:sulfate permease, SulP family